MANRRAASSFFSGIIGSTPKFTNTYSFNFDGIDDEVDPGITTGTNDVSISCWIKTTETAVYTDNRCAFGGLNTGGAYVMIGRMSSTFSTPDDMVVRVYNTLGTTKLNDGDWHNIIYTADYTTKEMKAYVDGNTTPEATTTIYAWSTYFWIFMGWNGSGTPYVTHFEGNVDECGYWTRIIDPADITAIWGTGVPNDISSLSPVGWWRMGDDASWDGSNWTLIDQGSGGNDGTSVNMVEADRETDVAT